jgi:hypothetical protein
MPWQSSPYRPPIQNPKGRIGSSPSAPVARFFGCVGFGLAGWATFKATQWLLGLPPGFLDAKWGPRETIVVGAAVLASLLGGLIGSGLGLQLSITSRTLTRFVIIVWHFLANGQIVCFALLTLALSRNRRSIGHAEALQAFGLFAAASIVAGLVLFAAGQFKENQQPRPLLWVAITVPITVWVGLRYQAMFHWQRGMAIVFGVVAGLGTVVVSARMIQRDYEQMKEMRDIVKRP